MDAALTDREFQQFRQLLSQLSGIELADSKKALVCARLGRRLEALRLKSYGDYYQRIAGGQDPGELETALNLLTTNETYFFREPRHFQVLTEHVIPEAPPTGTFRIWSAACSSGQEPYTLAMLLDDRLGSRPWEIMGSDLSTRVLDTARAGLYRLEEAQRIPQDYLHRYCLKGVGGQAGQLLVSADLRRRVEFRQINLVSPLPDVGLFDVIFLRNVMIYFDQETKRDVVGRLVRHLRPGGWFMVGHSETLNGLCDQLRPVEPAVYRKAPP